MDSQYRISGSILDLSTGGALVVGDARKIALEDGDIIIFSLPDAQIREDLVSQVVGILKPNEDTIKFHLQFQGLKEINRLKINRFLAKLKAEATPPPDEEEEDGDETSVAS